MKKVKDRIWMITFLVILAAVSSFALEFIANFTEPTILRNKALVLKQGVLNVLQVPYSVDSIESIYDQEITTETRNQTNYYISKSNQSKAFIIEGSGFMGKIKAVIGVNSDNSQLAGLQILEQEETPGLGGRISEPWFQDQFAGKTLTPSIVIAKTDKATGAPNEVDAITGATMTSRALEKLINNGLLERL